MRLAPPASGRGPRLRLDDPARRHERSFFRVSSCRTRKRQIVAMLVDSPRCDSSTLSSACVMSGSRSMRPSSQSA